MTAKFILLHAISPLHAGTGQGVGVIDMPIAREKATNLPYVPGSTIKGILNDYCRSKHQEDGNLCDRVFGKAKSQNLDKAKPQNPDDFYAGSIQFTDARLLLMPIRSLYGTFAWVTSPYILARLERDLRDAGLVGPTVAAPKITEMTSCLLTNASVAISAPDSGKVYLEDIDLVGEASPAAKTWAEWLGSRVFPHDEDWQKWLAERFCIVHDNILAFLLETATEITARISLDEGKKTAADGKLWYEEALPVETVVAALALTSEVKATAAEVTALLNELQGKVLQFGGKATVGRGLCRFQVA